MFSISAFLFVVLLTVLFYARGQSLRLTPLPLRYRMLPQALPGGGCLRVRAGVVAVFALFGLGAHGADVVIDDFSYPTTAEEVKSTSGAQVPKSWTGIPTVNTIGGFRDFSLGCEQGTQQSALSASLGGGSLVIDAKGNSAPSMYLAYDGNTGWNTVNPTYPASLESAPFNGVMSTVVDLTGGGTNNAIAFDITGIRGLTAGDDFGFNDFRITFVQGYTGNSNVSPGTIAYDSDGTPATGTAAYWYSAEMSSDINAKLQEVAEGEGLLYYFPLTSLVNVNNALPDFSQVQAIQIHACTRDAGFDYTLNSLTATNNPAAGPIPEPSTGAARAAVSLLAFLRRRRAGGNRL